MNKKTFGKIAKQRSLALVDIENLVGSSELSESQVATVKSQYFDAVAPGELDQFYVTSSHHNMQATCFGWPCAEHSFKSGKDGADILLAERIVNGDLKNRFNHVYIASGDGGLTEFVAHLVSNGLAVTIVANHRGFSRRLYETGAEIIFLDELELAA